VAVAVRSSPEVVSTGSVGGEAPSLDPSDVPPSDRLLREYVGMMQSRQSSDDAASRSSKEVVESLAASVRVLAENALRFTNIR
jgi:hypothetical protein